MTESRRCLARMRQARYSPLDLTLFLLLAVGGMTAGALRLVHNERRFWMHETVGSSLPEVVLAPTASPPGAQAYSKEYEFSQDWFAKHMPIWETALERFKGQPEVSYLEVGVYEGTSLIWMLEHILTHPTARATGVDVFVGPYKDTYSRNINLSGLADKTTTITGLSQVALRDLPLDSFDVIYIDGSHEKHDVLEDAVLSWRLLKKDGLLIFDDYRLSLRMDPGREVFEYPKMAIEPFVQCFQDQCEVIHNHRQLIIKKTEGPQEIKLLDRYAPAVD